MPGCAGAAYGAGVGEDRIDRASAEPLLVREVMLPRPKTVPLDATVADARAIVGRPNVKDAVVVDGTALAGLLAAGDIPPGVPADAPLRPYVRRAEATVRVDAPMGEALALLAATGASRLAVVGEDGATLAGLLCPNSEGSRFCRG